MQSINEHDDDNDREDRDHHSTDDDIDHGNDVAAGHFTASDIPAIYVAASGEPS